MCDLTNGKETTLDLNNGSLLKFSFLFDHILMNLGSLLWTPGLGRPVKIFKHICWIHIYIYQIEDNKESLEVEFDAQVNSKAMI